MKLHNKKTGKWAIAEIVDDRICLWFEDGTKSVQRFDTLSELNEEWEDYEEPSEPYRLTSYGEAVRFSTDGISNAHKRECVNVGNYFSTKEEAEKAVEKLKAWKRLKDKFNFGFNGIIKDEKNGKAIGARLTYTEKQITFQESYQVERDLYILFGGNDENQ